MKLTADDLMSLEEYARQRQLFRQQVMQHNLYRQIELGQHIRLDFEDSLTVRYRIQERLLADRISDPASIEKVLTAYSILLPDGHNWKATMRLVSAISAEDKIALQPLAGIEHKIWVQINGAERIYPVCDKPVEPEYDEQSNAICFLRFELHHDDISLLRQGAPILMGIDHPENQARVTLTASQHQALVADLD